MKYKLSEELTDEELIERLSERYEPSTIPPCNVCGGPLGIVAMGGGHPTEWACSGREYDPNTDEFIGFKEHRKAADEHYSKSHYTDRRQGGDGSVMELIKRYKEKSL